MTSRSILGTCATLIAIGVGAGAVAQSDELPYPVQARQGQFTLMQLNLGVLVSMMRGDMEYDQEQAQVAADNLVTLSNIDQSFHWPPGTDNESIEGTLALPAIWENVPDLISKWEDFGTAATAMSDAVAADGLDGIRASIGMVGGACTACHDAYQASTD